MVLEGGERARWKKSNSEVSGIMRAVFPLRVEGARIGDYG